MPKKMKYATQAIACLDADLLPTAKALQGKRDAAGDGGNSKLMLNAKERPRMEENSRLIILGHGDPKSHSISNRNITPKKLAELCNYWLNGTKIKRISLHMCYGGGNRGTASGSDANNFNVAPQNSFAYKFARYCGGLTVDVTARTDVVNGTTHSVNNVITNFERKVGGRRHAEGDKVVFTTNANSSLTTPADPKMQFVWKN